MDVFALLFIVSFLALIFTLVVMHIRKHIKTKGNVAKGSKHIGWVSDVLGRGSESTELRNDGKMHNIIVGKTSYVRSYDLESSWMQREVNEAQEKEHLVAFDPEIRKLLGINEQKLKDELNQMKRLHEGAIKTNETLVKYKNDLLKENEELVDKLDAYSFITFWQRLLFLFTGKLGDTK